MDTLASSLSLAFGYSDEGTSNARRQTQQFPATRPYRDVPSLGDDDNDRDEEDSSSQDEDDEDEDFCDFVDAGTAQSNASQPQHLAHIQDEQEEEFGDFASANSTGASPWVNDSWNSTPITTTATAVSISDNLVSQGHDPSIDTATADGTPVDAAAASFTESVPTWGDFGTFSSEEQHNPPNTHEMPSKADKSAVPGQDHGSMDVTYTAFALSPKMGRQDYDEALNAEKDNTFMDERQSYPEANPISTTTRTASDEFANFESTENAPVQVAGTDTVTSSEAFDFARPPEGESSSASTSPLELTLPSIPAQNDTPTCLPPPPSVKTTSSTKLPRLSPPKSQTSQQPLGTNQVDLLGDLIPTIESAPVTLSVQNDFDIFATPPDPAPMESTRAAVNDLSNDSHLPAEHNSQPLHTADTAEDEDWGDFTGFRDKAIESDTANKPQGRESRAFQVTKAGSFSFYNPKQETATMLPVPTKIEPSTTTTASPPALSNKSLLTVETATSSITDAVATMTAGRDSSDIKSLRRQLVEQEKEAAERIRALQSQHAKTLVRVRTDAQREAQKQYAKRVEDLQSSLRDAEAAWARAIPADPLAVSDKSLADVQAKHAQELEQRDRQMQRIKAQMQDTMRREMQTKLRERQAAYDRDMEQTRQQWEGRLREMQQQQQQQSSSSTSSPAQSKKVLAHQAEILSLQKKLEQAQHEASGKAGSAVQEWTQKEKQWRQTEQKLQQQVQQLEEDLCKLRESSHTRERADQESLQQATENAAEWQAKHTTLLQQGNTEKQSLQEQLDEARASVQTMKMNETRLSRQNQHLEKQLQASAESLAAACGSENAMQQTLQQQKESHDEMYRRMQAQLTRQRDHLQSQVAQLEATLQQTELSLETLQSTVQSEKAKTERLCRQEIKLQQASNKLQKSLAESQRDVQLRDKLIERLRNDLLGRDGELATLEKELAEAQEDLQKFSHAPHPVNLDYLKDVVVKYLSHPPGSSERAQLLPVLATLLKFNANDYQIIESGKLKLSWWGSVTPTLITSPLESLGMSEPGGVVNRSTSTATGTTPTTNGTS